MTLRRLPMCAELINQHYEDYSLLDLGCRTMDLKPLLKGCKGYHGTDFVGAEGVYECNLEEGLSQFEDNSFDIVVALDVLEHLDNAHFVFEEALRVAKKAVFVSLPNMYYIKFRLRFLLGSRLSDKYAFSENPIQDRHRWILTYAEAINFVRHNIQHKHTMELYDIPPPLRGRTRMISDPIECWLSKVFPSLFADGVLFMIKAKN